MNAMRNCRLSVEPLEPRLVPASVLTYTDLDGDRVTVRSSTGDLAGKGTLRADATGATLVDLDLTDPSFQGCDITTTVVRAPTGDGLVNIGRINATGRDLGIITVSGDLGGINCGDADTTTTALKTLRVGSIGRFGPDTQVGTGDLDSHVNGRLGVLTVRGDFVGAFIQVAGSLGRLTIGGSLIGGPEANSGRVQVGGATGSLAIGGTLDGGSGDNSGSVESSGPMGPVSVGRNVEAGSGSNSGLIRSFATLASLSVSGSVVGGGVLADGDMGPVRVGRDVAGGVIGCGGTLAGATVGGSVLGTDAMIRGILFSFGDMGPVKIGGDLVGGNGNETGKIVSGGNLASVTIGGTLHGGDGQYDTDPGQLGTRSVGQSGQHGSGEDWSRRSRGLWEVFGTDPSRRQLNFSVHWRLSRRRKRGGQQSDSSRTGHGPGPISGNLEGGSGDQSGKIASKNRFTRLTIGGSLLGGSGSFIGDPGANVDGQVVSLGNMGPVRIGRDVRGGDGRFSACIRSGGRLAEVTVGGSILGGAADVTGVVLSDGDMGPVTVGRDVRAGTGSGSAVIIAEGRLAGATIKGSLLGGPKDVSGGVVSHGNMGAVLIGGDLVGGSVSGTESVSDSGFITSHGRIARVSINGSIISGIDDSTGSLNHNAAIIAGNDLGEVTVKGSIVGNRGPQGDSPVLISSAARRVLVRLPIWQSANSPSLAKLSSLGS